MAELRTIWKYQLKLTDLQSLDLPIDGKILHFGMQGDKPCIWVEFSHDGGDEPQFTELRHFRIVGTGQFFDDTGLRYIGSTIKEYPNKELSFVWHLYERVR